MSKRSDHILLIDMLEAVDSIQEYIAGLDFAAFLSNRMVRDAVTRNLQVLGEAANRVSKPFRTQHVGVEWDRIIRTRHILVHDYFGLDYEIIWRIVTIHLPPLKESITQILASRSPDDTTTDSF